MMKVSPILITPYSLAKNNTKTEQSDQLGVEAAGRISSIPLVSGNYFLSFKGGNSIDLKKTMEIFDEAEEEEGKSIVPDRVREAANFVLENGNPKNLTLIDVHKHVYDDIRYAESLDEVKELYPEFKDVISSDDLDASEGSLISDVKQGKSQYFSKDEDLALQMLKLYWAEGFSTRDLKKYTDDKGVVYAMKKMQIPLLNKHYSIVLKFSDREYNERMSAEMSARKLQNLEQKSSSGTYVYIPRGKMSEEQKKKISESLIDYYSENPQRIYAQSMRQKEFYRNNPQAAETFRQVLEDAWGLGSSKPVKEALSRFMKNRGEKSVNYAEISQTTSLSAKMRLRMQEFWEQNPKAKEKFSTSMKCAWKRIKATQEADRNKIEFPIPGYPDAIKNKIRTWADKNGYKNVDINFNLMAFTANTKVLQRLRDAKVVTEFFDTNELISNVYADTLVCTLAAIRDYMLMYEPKTEACYNVVRKIESSVTGKKMMCTNDLVNLYIDISRILLDGRCVNAICQLGKIMNDSYLAVISMRKSKGMPVPQ